LHFWIADRSYYEKKDWIFTKSQYNIVFQLEPNNSVYRMWYGIHLTEKGLLKKAVIELKKSVKMGLNRKNKMLAKSSILKCKQSGKL